MEFGQHELQLFVSLTLIMGAACVALICDFLKGDNEQLRQLVTELNVRREEEQKRAPEAKPAGEPAKIEPAKPVAESPKQHTAEKDAPRAERKRGISSEALAAMERGAALAKAGGPPPAAKNPESRPAAAKQAGKPPKQAVSVKTVAVKKDWDSILSRKPAKAAQPAAGGDLLSAVVAATTASEPEVTIPEGFHDGYVLRQLVQSRRPVSGLVVSIGVNTPRNADGAMPASVNELIQSLLGPRDFAARSADDEFLLIYPEEQGASAQRRLSQIAQQLWDFQLRSLGSFQILFSWGGVEVLGETMEEAIASASERMQETKRGRKLLTMPAQSQPGSSPLRQAV